MHGQQNIKNERLVIRLVLFTRKYGVFEKIIQSDTLFIFLKMSLLEI
jgi:hypothetical protein